MVLFSFQPLSSASVLYKCMEVNLPDLNRLSVGFVSGILRFISRNRQWTFSHGSIRIHYRRVPLVWPVDLPVCPPKCNQNYQCNHRLGYVRFTFYIRNVQSIYGLLELRTTVHYIRLVNSNWNPKLLRTYILAACSYALQYKSFCVTDRKVRFRNMIKYVW